MGNRCVIYKENEEKGIFLHWNGGRDTVEPVLEVAKELGLKYDEIKTLFRFFVEPDFSDYSILDKDNGDNGVYIINDDFKIVERLYNKYSEQKSHDPKRIKLLVKEYYLLTEAIIKHIQSNGYIVKTIKASICGKEASIKIDTEWDYNTNSHSYTFSIEGNVFGQLPIKDISDRSPIDISHFLAHKIINVFYEKTEIIKSKIKKIPKEQIDKKRILEEIISDEDCLFYCQNTNILYSMVETAGVIKMVSEQGIHNNEIFEKIIIDKIAYEKDHIIVNDLKGFVYLFLILKKY